MNSSKLDATPSKKEFADKKSAREKRKKNIREIYLNAVNQNRNARGSFNRIKTISNIQNIAPGSSSNFLENEYNLVKKIITATRALEKLKTNSDKNSSSISNSSSTGQLRHQASLSNIAGNFCPQTTFQKSPEEYNQEVLDLKKQIKFLQNNETISKAKFEYYETEIAKKDQEILDLLDAKKAEEVRTLGDAKSDLNTMVSTLKLKAFKLELSVKKKERELNKLKDELKTTNMKELKIQNEKLRHELSKALMNDAKIIDGHEMDLLFMLKDKSIKEIHSDRKLIETLANKNEILKHNIAKLYQRHLSEAELSKYNTDIYHKLVLKGTLKEQLAQLDLRETELLNVIAHMLKELEAFKSSKYSLRHSRADMHQTGDESVREKQKLSAIKTIQSVMKGHLERSSSVKRERKEKDRQEREREEMLERENEILRSTKSASPSPTPRRYESRSPRRSATPPMNHHRRRDSDDFDNRSRRPNYQQGRRSPYDQDESSDSDDDDKKLIPKKSAETTDGGCCSPWRSRKDNNNKK